MTTENQINASDHANVQVATIRSEQKSLIFRALIISVIITVLYWRVFKLFYTHWTLVDSYYSHGFLIVPVSIYLVWLNRKNLLSATIAPSYWGYFYLLMGAFFLILGAFLGFTVLEEFSIVPMITGISFLMLGKEHTKIMWFALFFLLFMIPLPASVTQSIALNLKLLAAEGAVIISRILTFPMIRQGSYIHFKDDYLLVGEVCGGLRSLISLLALGALMAYFSKSKNWAKALVLILSGPIAIVSNVVRIFMLCFVGYFWGSEIASGKFHDISGFFIFAIAFMLFFSLEAFLRRIAPCDTPEEVKK